MGCRGGDPTHIVLLSLTIYPCFLPPLSQWLVGCARTKKTVIIQMGANKRSIAKRYITRDPEPMCSLNNNARLQAAFGCISSGYLLAGDVAKVVHDSPTTHLPVHLLDEILAIFILHQPPFLAREHVETQNEHRMIHDVNTQHGGTNFLVRDQIGIVAGVPKHTASRMPYAH